MNVIRMTVSYAGEAIPRAYMVYENCVGKLDIIEVGRPCGEADRSICVHLDRGDAILTVERLEVSEPDVAIGDSLGDFL